MRRSALFSRKPVSPLTHKRIRVWDLPVRVFHWGLVASYVLAWVTKGSRYLDIHVFAGYMMAGLIGFRIVWGVVGSRHARFRDFWFGWRQTKDHLLALVRRAPHRYPGHNPAGAVVIYGLLVLSAGLTMTGLMTLGGEEQHGPLAGLLDFPQGEKAHDIHELLAWVTLGVVAIHLAGVVVESLLLRENLIVSMITGFKSAAGSAIAVPSRKGVGTGMLLVMVMFSAGWFRGYLTATPDDPYLPFKGPSLTRNPIWEEECGGCHLAFHPSLLPRRSWEAMLRSQADHFGEDLFLDEAVISELRKFAAANSAESSPTEAAWKMDRAISPRETPLRITETPYWKRKHGDLPETVWRNGTVAGKSDCAACHLDARLGTFEDAAMRLPGE